MIGAVLCGKYRLEDLLGAGGTASVSRGSQRNGHRDAVKVLHAEYCWNTEVRARFLKEAYIANTIEHRGAVPVLDDDVAENGAAFLVMELLEGETVADRWER